MDTGNSHCYPKQGFLYRLCTYTAKNQPGHLHFSHPITKGYYFQSGHAKYLLVFKSFHSMPTSSLLWVNPIFQVFHYFAAKITKRGKLTLRFFTAFPSSLTRTGNEDRQIRTYSNIRATVYSFTYFTCVHWAQLITKSWIKDRAFLQALLIAITHDFFTCTTSIPGFPGNFSKLLPAGPRL